MSIVGQGPGQSALVQRIKKILFEPQKEWDVIDAEPATVKGLYRNYICILAAIGPVANLIGSMVFGFRDFLGITHHSDLIPLVVQALVEYLLSLAGTYLVALAIDALAPSFGGQQDRLKALKVVAYSWTAIWVFAVFALVPNVSALSIIGLYSIYLLYVGLPKLMKAPQDKAIVYTAVSVIVGLLIYAVIRACAHAVVGGGLSI